MTHPLNPSWQGGISQKPDWDVLFMAECLLIAQRSIDPSTVHGSVWVDKNNKPLSRGYNGPLQDSDDINIPLTRPEKYYLFLHSEENCILNYNGSSADIENSTLYISGKPCHKCLRMILQKGIKNIIYGPVNSKCIDELDLQAQNIMLKNRNISITKFDKMEKVIELLNKTLSYIKYKTDEESTT